MQVTRRRVLIGLLLASLVLAGVVLSSVIWTVFFAATVAYVLVPAHTWLRSHGLPSWWAAVVATSASVTFLSVFVGLAGFLLYRRRGQVIVFLTTLPETVDVSLFGMHYVFQTDAAMGQIVQWLTRLFIQFVAFLPSLSLKFAVFAFVVFGLLAGHVRVEETFLNVVPAGYRDVARAFAARIRMTLFAIYVLQVVTAVATFLVALPVFFLLGYDIFLTLSFVAGFLQFLPIVGPSILIVALAAYHVAIGETASAIAVLVLGGVLVALLPDIVVRPRLAERTGRLRGTLYFVGFVGGLLTVGPIGVIAGPLVVALVVEAMGQLESATA